MAGVCSCAVDRLLLVAWVGKEKFIMGLFHLLCGLPPRLRTSSVQTQLS
jgi:hypothetical protein